MKGKITLVVLFLFLSLHSNSIFSYTYIDTLEYRDKVPTGWVLTSNPPITEYREINPILTFKPILDVQLEDGDIARINDVYRNWDFEFLYMKKKLVIQNPFFTQTDDATKRIKIGDTIEVLDTIKIYKIIKESSAKKWQKSLDNLIKEYEKIKWSYKSDIQDKYETKDENPFNQ